MESYQHLVDETGATVGNHRLSVDEAQELAVDILARHPLERVEPEVMEDWKADASRYLKDSNMLTRRFARRVIALVDGFEEALVQLSAHAAVEEALGGKPAKPEERPYHPMTPEERDRYAR